MKKFKLLVFIGRFQPFHMGHKNVIDEALSLSENVLILVGSAGSPRTLRNPFSYEERVDMISESYPKEAGLIFHPLFDKTYNDQAWINQVQSIINDTIFNIINPSGGWTALGTNDVKTGLIGHQRDNTSYYLKLFPQYESIPVKSPSNINATQIRKILFSGTEHYHTMLDSVLPKSSADFLYKDDKGKSIIDGMRKEYDFKVKHDLAWKDSPYAPTFNTVDALVEQSGHVLLIRRRAEPGKGLYAMPGGYVDQGETLQQSMIRELKEETKIKVPDKVILGSIVNVFDADSPHRSDRGRIISKVYHIKLNDDVKLPKVKGSDDADKAIWLPISELKESEMFEDHYHIICKLLGI